MRDLREVISEKGREPGILLPDWEESRGANRELGFALGTDKIVVTYEALRGGRCHDIE